ncbi:alpha/beta fold hydrolase [Streptomyces sp. NPDC060030]|uniref:alpha/beta fold hydrolase n=1 Tax=Streptomyces sp. NPDC060030 TaxID=3347042 RepID=UPI0036A7BB36
MTPTSRSKMPRMLALAALVPAAVLISAAPAAATNAGEGKRSAEAKPTVVLVHGLWADASGWNEITERLQRDGFPVVATANPLRGLTGDSEYLAARLKSIEGPIVLVGHSYGGAVITNAANGNPNIKSLVYIAGLQPDTGETALALSAKYPGSRLSDDPTAPLPTALTAVPIPGPGDPGENVDLYLRPEKFREVFLSDRLDPETSDALAASQRPARPATFAEPSKTPAWKTVPSWAMVATLDYTIGAQNERFMARRAGSHTVEVNAPHAVHLTDPDAVTDMIRAAAGSSSEDLTPGLARTGSPERTRLAAGISVLALVSGGSLYAFSRRVRTVK